MCAEDVEKLVNNRLRDLRIGGNFEDALRMEVDQANSSPFTAEIEQAAPPKRFSTPSFTCFKGDSDPESHLKHFKSEQLRTGSTPCHLGRSAASRSLLMSSPRNTLLKKNPDHLFNLYKKSDESLRDYIKRFKAERAKIIGCDDQVASSAFKRGLPTECELYGELTISPCQTLVEVLATAERYALWDDDRIAAKKAAKQADQPAEQASQRNGNNKDEGKRRSQPEGSTPATESYTKFTIPIHHILAQVRDMPWLKKPSPLKGNLAKKDDPSPSKGHALVEETIAFEGKPSQERYQ
ncbi:uncharacterized protein LOC110744998 [Prunus avium]|uniref:Uncharacterized protein LOC110744998 n=1 Tax=Prunus avium TaxID=42229 RepID=A0A6P5RIV0_PRUAV|nr:uncharacterized protein LOC110744998 [Prunus avium]